MEYDGTYSSIHRNNLQPENLQSLFHYKGILGQVQRGQSNSKALYFAKYYNIVIGNPELHSIKIPHHALISD